MSLARVLALAAVWCVLTRELTLVNAGLGLALAALLGRWARGGAAGRRAGGAGPSEEVASEGIAPEEIAPGGVASRGSPRPRTLAVAGRKALVKPLRALELAAFFLYELVLSNVRIAALVVRPRLRLTPMILDVPVDAESEEELALLSDLVTLTPGTLTLDVTDDGRALLVHVLSARDPSEVRRQIRDGLGRRVRRLFE